MKKVFYTASALFLLVGGWLTYMYLQYGELDQKHVNLKPGIVESIVLVNVGSLNRSELAEKIMKIDSCNCSLLVVDLFLTKFQGLKEDSILLEAILKTRPILATRHGGIGTHGVHQFFLNASSGYGYAETIKKAGYASSFIVENHDSSRHLAYEVALRIDEQKALAKREKFLSDTANLKITRLPSQFITIDSKDSIKCEEIQGTIAIVGTLGPGYEDKHRTYARHYTSLDEDGPDMYGPIIVANQILMFLED